MYKNIYVARQNMTDMDTINGLHLHAELPRWDASLAEFLV